MRSLISPNKYVHALFLVLAFDNSVNKEDKDLEAVLSQTGHQEEHSSSSTPIEQNAKQQNQNCISSLQECLNEIMQKPRRDSSDIAVK